MKRANAVDENFKLSRTLGSPWAAKRVRSVSTGWTATVAAQAASPPQTKCTKESRALYEVTLCTSFVKLSNAMNLRKQTHTGQGDNPYHWHGSPAPLVSPKQLHPPLSVLQKPSLACNLLEHVLKQCLVQITEQPRKCLGYSKLLTLLLNLTFRIVKNSFQCFTCPKEYLLYYRHTIHHSFNHCS